jgi:hypothetical protein
MRPNAEELLRGAQRAMVTYLLPELQSDFARTELMLTTTLLTIAANQWDGAAQSLVDDNRALRSLAARAAESPATDGFTADELHTLANASDPSVRVSELAAANAALRDALGRYAVAAPVDDEARAAIVAHLLLDAEAHSIYLLGPRADG